MKHFLYIAAAALALAPVACVAQSVSGPRSVALTVYNGGFALVKDTRTITLNKGVNSIEIADVAAKIDPTSILFKPLNSAGSVSILEQNYQYDLISPDSILKKLVGQRVWFNKGEESGILLNPPGNGGIVVRKDDGQIVTDVWVRTVDRLPEGLKPTPTLNWLIESTKTGAQNSQISYITDGMSWQADYVALVNDKDTALDLTGWVTMNNQSGATYKNAKLTLMAGDVRRESPVMEERYRKARTALAYDAKGSQFEEKSFFEYHLYSMARPTTIADKETKQLALLSAANVPLKKEMIYDARGAWFKKWWSPTRTNYDPGSGFSTSNYHKVNVVLEATNSKENHMGMPLPKGRIRVYKLDDTGSQQFIGEDQIDHTPKDEKIRLYIGDAFDVVGDYKRTNYSWPAKDTVLESFEVVIRNHKDTSVNVNVVEHVWSDWAVTAKTHPFTKKDAHTIEFPVKVPANGSVKINYTIKTKW